MAEPIKERWRLCAPFLAALGAGCSNLAFRVDRPLDLEACASFELEATRRADVLAALGPPSEVGTCTGGVALLYESLRLDERQFGIGFGPAGDVLGLTWLRFLKLSLGSSGVRRRAAVFVFAADGRLVAAGHARWREDFGSGGSLQFIAKAEQVVDAESLRAAPDALEWGRRLLEPLPEALNRAYVPELELLGTPGGAGQHALELLDPSAERRR